MNNLNAAKILEKNVIVPYSVFKDLSGSSIEFYIRMLCLVHEGRDVFSSMEDLVQFALDSRFQLVRESILPCVNELLEAGYLKHVASDEGEEIFFTYGPVDGFERCVCGKLPDNYQG